MNVIWILVSLGVGFVAGFVVSYFVMRNNKKYFDLDDMLKDKAEKLTVEGKAALKARLRDAADRL